ncbi:MAG: MBL fold metallo-hydrolase RNA specificity domain-containing protein [Limnochordia bacterium]|nr:MBL fold metallo-hydrolase RNA specificity domain-containing protein [Limnochordia bacterium]NLO94951.1 MBL fold metallo-hydrolase [Bacillota bacterium]HOB39547.1 MBL fold metallo-hydrolase RNA specificity domain-containing protein [Limnochordia bacterium]HPU64363.1 MBL fold metallo-hydrolase RNA specificity domain-containing protein [Limnochordia bacterium]HPZ79087.1 MBL fold metallo-hydrolase RNA specificity domain-containing protein [Limnochordia bacterium]
MRIQFLGAAGCTSGSCYLLAFGDKQVLVDCGLFQGPEELKQRNYGDFPFVPGEIDGVILTHAHIDHSGLLPKLTRLGFRGPIYATGVTADLCEIMLADSAHIQEMEVERKNRKLRRRGQPLLTPIYTVADAERTMEQFARMVYDEEIEVFPDLRVRFRDAGHILGAAIVELWITEGEETTKFVFSGDLGNLDQPIVQDPTFLTEADVLVIESTYGTRLHENREERLKRLAEVVNRTMERGGNLLIPAFALGRTQDILHSLRVLQDQGQTPPLTIYIDSPLASKATAVFRRHSQVFDYETREMIREQRSPFQGPGVHYTESVEESKRLNSISGGVVIISASGMADAGRIKHHLKHNLWRREAAVLLVGYQAEGTLGRRLQDGAQRVRIHGEEVQVAAEIETISGFSAHADQAGLLRWLRRFRHIGQVFVTHGEKESSEGFAELIRGELEVPVLVPQLDESFELKGTTALSTWDTHYRGFSVEDDFSGVCQVTKKAKVQFRGAFGYAHRRFKIPNNPYTAFNLGSARQFFAQVALARLGQLEGAEEPERRLAAITGEKAWEVVEREVLLPGKLGRTSYLYLDQLPAWAATGYTISPAGRPVENIYALPGDEPQLFAGAPDLVRFWQLLAQGQLLPAETVERLLAPYWDARLRVYKIEGRAPGAHVLFGGTLEEPMEVVVLSNGEQGALHAFEQLAALGKGGELSGSASGQ